MPILFPKRQCGQRCNRNKCMPGRICTRVYLPGYVQKDGKTCGKQRPRCSNVVKPQCPDYQRPLCKRGQRISTTTLKNGCKKPICVNGKPTRPIPGPMPMPIEGPQPCPKSVKICPVGQKRVLKSGYGPLPKPRRERKGGRSSKSGRPRGRKLLSEDGEDALPPHVMRERCGPVYVCVPDVKPQCPKYRPPRCRRGQRISTTTLKNGCKKPICVNGKPTRPIPGPMPILFPKRQCGQRCNQYKCKPGRKCKRVFIPGYIQKDGKTCGKQRPRCSNVVKPQCPEYQRPRCRRGQKVISLRLKNGCKKTNLCWKEET